MEKEQSHADGNQSQVDDNTSGGSKGDNKVSFESYDRVVRDNKKLQARFKEVEQTLNEKLKLIDDFEKGELESQGKKDELIAKLKKELGDKDAQLKEKTNTFAYERLKDQIRAEAVKAGCVNPEKLFKLLDPSDLRGIKLNDRFSADENEIKSLVDKAKEDHSDIGLFGAISKRPNDVIPNSQTQKVIGKDDLKNLSVEQLKNLHREKVNKEGR